MFIVPPEIFEKWKDFLVEDKRLSDLDKQMKNILYNNKITDLEKWQLYKQNLQKYINTKSGISFNNKINIDNNNREILHKQMENVGVQTNKIFKKEKKIQATPLISELGTQTAGDDIKSSEPLENIFETSNMYSSIDGSDVDLSFIPEDVDARDIVREGSSKDTSEYRIFEMKNGDVITVPRESVGKTTKNTKRKQLKTPEKGSKQSTLNYSC